MIAIGWALLSGCGGADCRRSLDEICRDDCPTRDALPCEVGDYTDPLFATTCRGYDAFICTGTNIEAELWMFDGDRLVLYATNECPPPQDGTEDCRSSNGWTSYGELTGDLQDCLDELEDGLYCFE
jgi:hypothetical protein